MNRSALAAPVPLEGPSEDLLTELEDPWVSGPDADGFVWLGGRRRGQLTVLSCLNITLVSAAAEQAALSWREADPAMRTAPTPDGGGETF